MKKTCFMLPVLVAVVALLSATKVGAACDPNLPLGWCFESAKFRVEIVDPSGTPIPANGTFPVIDANGNSVFTYKISRTQAGKSISHIDILIPVCTPNGLTPTNPLCNGSPCSATLYPAGLGESSTGFGLGLTSEQAYKWYCSSTGNLSFTLAGSVYASPNAMLLKVGSSVSDFAYGKILAPSCTLIPAAAYPPVVPQATLKEEQIGDIKVCIESTDPSGCPTTMYSCWDGSQYTDFPCDCQSPNIKMVWDKKLLKDIGIPQGKLKQVLTDNDPRCPGSFLVTGTATCVKKCYPSGYCYQGPPNCVE